MTVTITPGYDFGINEVPTASTFGLQATGIQITGIPLSAIDADMAIVNINDASNASSVPNEGSMWVDHQTNVWGRTRWGPTKVRPYGGALESNRFSTRNSNGLSMGHRVEIGDDGSAYTTASCAAIDQNGTAGTPGLWVTTVTIPSSAGDSYYPRIMTGPGFIPIYHLNRAPAAIGRQERLGHTAGTRHYVLTGYNNISTEGVEGDILSAQTSELNGDTSSTSSGAFLYGGNVGGRLEIT